MTKPISLINVAKYYENQTHQNEALMWLESQTPNSILTEFAHKYRNNDADSPPSVPTAFADIDWSDTTAKVSKYFTVAEVINNDYRRIPTSDKIKHNIFQLAQELDKVREEWGKPIIVTSWYRPPEINAAVGGVSNSQHIHGLAADIRPKTGNIYQFQEWLDNGLWKNKALGYGAARGFVHCDLRNSRIRWNY